LKELPQKGEFLLDAASGPVQYPEYLEYSKNFKKHYCVDLSEAALKEAKRKLGDKGEYIKGSILELPFQNNFFDSTISLHTIYHIDKADQEKAVRELIRVSKPEVPIVIIYANPQRPGNLIKVSLRTLLRRQVNRSPIPYHAYPLSWWNRFSDTCTVTIKPWRALTAGSSKRLIPDNGMGKKMFDALNHIEDALPALSLRLGAYPMIILKKRGAS
jgi:ubiquinone/menaquinone biosynthesis C-methylase UbiE